MKTNEYVLVKKNEWNKLLADISDLEKSSEKREAELLKKMKTEQEDCMYVKRKEFEALQKKAQDLSIELFEEQEKKDIRVAVAYVIQNQYNDSRVFVETRTDVTSSILSPGLQKQVGRIAREASRKSFDMIEGYIAKDKPALKKRAKINGFKEALSIAKNNFAWMIPKRINERIASLEKDLLEECSMK